MEKTKKISNNQLCAIIVGLFIAMRPIIRVSMQAKILGRDSYFTALFSMLINAGFAILLVYLAYKNPGKSFYEIVKDCLGTVTAKIILLLLAVFFFFKVITINFEMRSFLYETLYSDINWGLFTIPIYITFAFLAYKGVRVIGRSYQFFLPFALVAIALTFALSIPSCNFQNLLPILDTSFNKFLESVYVFTTHSGDFLFITLIMEYILNNDKKTISKVSVASLISIIVVVVFYIIYLSVFGSLSQYVKEGLVKITQFSPMSDYFFKPDALITLMWIPIIVLEQALAIYGIAMCFNKVFNLKMLYGIILSVSSVYIIELIPQITPTELINFYFNKLAVVMLIFELCVPIIVFTISMIKNTNDLNNLEQLNNGYNKIYSINKFKTLGALQNKKTYKQGAKNGKNS